MARDLQHDAAVKCGFCFKGRVHNTVVCIVLCGCETRPFRVEHGRSCLYSTEDVFKAFLEHGGDTRTVISQKGCKIWIVLVHLPSSM